MKHTLAALLLSAAVSASAVFFVDVPAEGTVALPDGGRLVEVQYFGPAGTYSISGVRTFATNGLEIVSSTVVSTNYVGVFTVTNAITHALVTNTVSESYDFLPTLPAQSGRTLLSYATNVTSRTTAVTNAVALPAYCSTNSLAPVKTATAGTPDTSSTNLYVGPGVRIIRTGTGAGRVTAVFE